MHLAAHERKQDPIADDFDTLADWISAKWHRAIYGGQHSFTHTTPWPVASHATYTFDIYDAVYLMLKDRATINATANPAEIRRAAHALLRRGLTADEQRHAHLAIIFEHGRRHSTLSNT